MSRSLLIFNNSVNLKYRSKNDTNMDKWKCMLCDDVYDPAAGDSDAGVAPGTAFEDLLYGWVSLWCGAPKDAFRKT